MRNTGVSLILVSVASFIMLFLSGCGTETQGENPGKRDPGGKLVIYTSMKESLIGAIVDGFRREHPDIDVDYQSAGAGQLMAKIAAERQSGRIMADVIWTSEVPDFYEMKQEGLLEKFRPSAMDEILNPFDDYDGSFTAARLGTMAIIVNTKKVSDPPKTWEDIATQPIYKDSFGIADPALSGTAYMGIAFLEKQFGQEYLLRLKDNGVRKSMGSGRVIDDTASGELAACLGVDYIAISKIDKGAPLELVYPKELLVIPSPVAIFKDSARMDAAKTFVEYLLGPEAQQAIANAGTVPVRKDVQMPEKYNLPSPEDTMASGIKVNYGEIMREREVSVDRFSKLFGKNGQ